MERLFTFSANARVFFSVFCIVPLACYLIYFLCVNFQMYVHIVQRENTYRTPEPVSLTLKLSDFPKNVLTYVPADRLRNSSKHTTLYGCSAIGSHNGGYK
jgi:hypothetical protein